MRLHVTKKALFVVIFAFGLFISSAASQTSQDDAYKAEKQAAFDLYRADHKLEALPTFEALALKNPTDYEVLVALGACLVAHTAILQDKDAAGRELLRARDILLRAKELGSTSTLMLNLLDTLQGVSSSGQVKYSDIPEADQAFRDAEAAFVKNDYPEAIKFYTKALDLDPKNAHAALFIGDSYFAAKDYSNAGEWYERASQLDPNNETAYRYYADMLTKNGEMEKARTKAIQAVVADPYNAIPWRGLQQWANANHIQLNRVVVKTPASVEQKDEKNITITLGTGQKDDAGAAWMVYGMIKATWHTEEFKKHFPDVKEYRHSLAEESAALNGAADLATGNGKKKSSKPPKDPDLALLWKLQRAGMIEPYILLSAADQGIVQDYAAYREKNRSKLEEYMSTFVVPPAPPKK